MSSRSERAAVATLAVLSVLAAQWIGQAAGLPPRGAPVVVLALTLVVAVCSGFAAGCRAVRRRRGAR